MTIPEKTAFPDSLIVQPAPALETTSNPTEWTLLKPVLKFVAVVTPLIFKLPESSNTHLSDESKLYNQKRLSTPAGVVILVIPDILFKLICDIILFIIQQHNYHQLISFPQY